MNQDTISDNRRHNFFIVDNAVLDNYALDPHTGWVYMWLLRRTNRQTGVAFPSLTKLAEDTQISRRQVIRCIQVLEEKGLLTVERASNSVNHYILQSPVVTDSHQGSDCESPGVVTMSHPNKTKLEQEGNSEEIESSDSISLPATSEPEPLPAIEESSEETGEQDHEKVKPNGFGLQLSDCVVGLKVWYENHVGTPAAIVWRKPRKRVPVVYYSDGELKKTTVNVENLERRIIQEGDAPEPIDAVDLTQLDKAPKTGIKSDPRYQEIEKAVINLFYRDKIHSPDDELAGNERKAVMEAHGFNIGRVVDKLYKTDGVTVQTVSDFRRYYSSKRKGCSLHRHETFMYYFLCFWKLPKLVDTPTEKRIVDPEEKKKDDAYWRCVAEAKGLMGDSNAG